VCFEHQEKAHRIKQKHKAFDIWGKVAGISGP
jgi:hypothetical protein